MTEPLRIAYAVAEAYPWCMTGGLAEVSGALPQALRESGAEVSVFLPLYREVKRKVEMSGSLLVDTGAKSGVWLGPHYIEGRFLRILGPQPGATGSGAPGSDVPTYAFDCPVLFDREGLYGHPDDVARFSTFCRAVLDCSTELMAGAPDVFHVHDWHTALIPVYLSGPYRERLPNAASVLTIHNLGYQGVFPNHELLVAGLGWEHYTIEKMEFFGRINLMKGGIATADALTTVSPRYAQEIQSSLFGERLEGMLATHKNKLSGILNGVDTQAWNPSTDPLIPSNYDINSLDGKTACRNSLLESARFDTWDRTPVFGVISRFARQKGIDLVAEIVPWLAQRGVRLLVLGQGEAALEEWLRYLERQFPNNVRVRFAHEPALAHAMQAGCDAVLMPSRYEPCGLGQLYAMRYGTVPIVRAVGGLLDTVVETPVSHVGDGQATGFRYHEDTTAGLQAAVDRALSVFYTAPDTWRQIQLNGMRQDFSWDRSAGDYIEVFQNAIIRRRA
jgi:starch synthase